MTTKSTTSKTIRYPKPVSGPPIPDNERERLGAVQDLNQVHSESQPALIALRNTARRLLKAPVAFIGMIEEETQRLLTVCIIPQGKDAAPGVDFKEMVTPRDCSVCQYTIMESDHLVIRDMDAFMRGETGKHYPAEFRQQALDLGGYPIPWPNQDGEIEMRPAQFYAGATIVSRQGFHIGTFCIVDVIPRPEFGAAEIKILEDLAAQAAEYLEDRALLRYPANLRLLEQARDNEKHSSEHSTRSDFDVIVMGGGPAGTTAACRLSFQGLTVALIEPKEYFGAPTGMNSKVLREVAIEHGKTTSWDHVRAIRELIGSRDAKRITAQLKRYGVSLVRGYGSIKGSTAESGSTEVEVRDADGKTRTLNGKAAVLSTGSRARRLPSIPFDNVCIFDSDSINGLEQKPESLFIQGTGVIALEYATIFSAMGVDVTIACRGSRDSLLPNLDVSLRDALVTDLDEQGVEILFDCTVEKWESADGEAHLTLNQTGNISTRRFAAAMSAVGRVPVSENLGLETLEHRRESTSSNPLETDDQKKLRGASNPIYAVGDLSGTGLACRAVVQAQEVVDDLLPQLVHGKESGVPSSSSRATVGSASVVWSIPELAFVGHTEDSAAEAFGASDIITVHTPFSETIRGNLHGLPHTYFLKLVCLKQDGRILGVHIYGEGASELIHLGATLVSAGDTVFKLQYRTFPAVTFHEIYKNGAIAVIDALAGTLKS